MFREFDFDVILPSDKGWLTYKASKLLVAKVSESFFIKLFGLLSMLIMSFSILFEDGLSLTTGASSILIILIAALSLLLNVELKSTQSFLSNKKSKTLKGDRCVVDFFLSRMKGGVQLLCVSFASTCALLGIVFLGNVSGAVLIAAEIMALVYLVITLTSISKIARLKKVVDTPSKDFKLLIKN